MHPPVEPFETGMLARPDGNEIYWETSGNPAGIPAMYLHGGPGSGLGAGGYFVVGIDQRGCGRSRPLVTDDLDALGTNTTAALLADIEAVRTHLGIETWVVSGVSWGTTLALAYALEHPKRVRGLVLVAVTTTSRDEVEWITETVGRLFPEAWQQFERESGRRGGERIVDAYARRLATTDSGDTGDTDTDSGDSDSGASALAADASIAADREAAAASWDRWESTHVSLDPNWVPGPSSRDPQDQSVFATLVTHYWAHNAFLPEGQHILDRVDEIAHIPAVLIHGRHDVSGPVITPWRLHQAWPASRLVIVESEGHGGPLSMQHMCDALDEIVSSPLRTP
jgi:proline iminopeptidase